MPGKYTPLETYLRNIPKEQNEISLTFIKIEQIIADKLPQSALVYHEWWNNEQ